MKKKRYKSIDKRDAHEDRLIDAIGKYVNQEKIKPKFHQTAISEIWAELMGDLIAKYTSSIKVQNNKLILHITSGPLKQELAYNKDKLIALVNEKMGDEYIKDVIIR